MFAPSVAKPKSKNTRRARIDTPDAETFRYLLNKVANNFDFVEDDAEIKNVLAATSTVHNKTVKPKEDFALPLPEE